jgi:hypothetical protein
VLSGRCWGAGGAQAAAGAPAEAVEAGGDEAPPLIAENEESENEDDGEEDESEEEEEEAESSSDADPTPPRTSGRARRPNSMLRDYALVAEGKEAFEPKSLAEAQARASGGPLWRRR